MKKVFCQKLKEEKEALKFKPYPNKIGDKIFNNISKEAWDLWLSHQTMLINEYRLSLIEPKSRKFLMEEMEKFLFQDKDIKPSGFVAE